MLGQQDIPFDAAQSAPGLEIFRDDKLLLAATYWGLIRGDKAAPLRADLDPGAMPPDILPWIVLFMTEGDRIRIRLAGTGLRDFLGRDATGRYVDELTPNREYNDYVSDRLMRVRDTGRCLYCETATVVDGDSKQTQRFIAPMSMTGQNIDMLFMCLSYESDGDVSVGRGLHPTRPHLLRPAHQSSLTFEHVTEFFLDI